MLTASAGEEMKINLNGVPAEVDAGRDDVVLDILRDDLGLTGAKAVCRTGVCGACTIGVDGTPQASCLLPAAAVEGRSITTAEGLDHPVQRAFAAHDGLQCGYCTPGFVLSTTALLEENPAPTTDEIKDYLAGNLCRCGAYAGIYAAIEAACRGEHDATSAEHAAATGERAAVPAKGVPAKGVPTKGVAGPAEHAAATGEHAAAPQGGAAVAVGGAAGPAAGSAGPAGGAAGPARGAAGPAGGAVGPARGAVGPAGGAAISVGGVAGPAGDARVEAMEKITGRARYTTDVRLDGQLEGVIIRSARAHARVTDVQVDAVHLVDLLPPDRIVRYVGQPIAGVAAPTRRAARTRCANGRRRAGWRRPAN
jgi:aerobic-type carbon monoxide dehydrogenase small subunit (CoxS/CutS family)